MLWHCLTPATFIWRPCEACGLPAQAWPHLQASWAIFLEQGEALFCWMSHFCSSSLVWRPRHACWSSLLPQTRGRRASGQRLGHRLLASPLQEVPVCCGLLARAQAKQSLAACVSCPTQGAAHISCCPIQGMDGTSHSLLCTHRDSHGGRLHPTCSRSLANGILCQSVFLEYSITSAYLWGILKKKRTVGGERAHKSARARVQVHTFACTCM